MQTIVAAYIVCTNLIQVRILFSDGDKVVYSTVLSFDKQIPLATIGATSWPTCWSPSLMIGIEDIGQVPFRSQQS